MRLNNNDNNKTKDSIGFALLMCLESNKNGKVFRFDMLSRVGFISFSTEILT